jgi:hypothetical protein
MPGAPAMPGAPGAPGTPGTPGTPETPGTGQQGADLQAQAPEAGGQPPASFSPGMFGDLLGVQNRRVVVVPAAVTRNPRLLNQFRILGGNTAVVIAPQVARSASKITENESPRPTDRCYFAYNYYNDVQGLLANRDLPHTDAHRETIGFERTFLNGDASFGMRLPFLELSGRGSDFEDSQIQDLDFVFKYALLNNRDNGDVLSAGMVVTAPTGRSLLVQGQSSIHPFLFQPFVGSIFHLGEDLFVQGFSSLQVPTDMRDVTVLYNSLALGYQAFRNCEDDAILRGVTPQVELHLNTPLSRRGLERAPIGFADSLDLTGGVFFQLNRAVLGAALCVPLTGPKPYEFEGAVTLNVHF